MRTVSRTLLFSLASNAAVLFVLLFGVFLWPERLPANSQNIFWLASGVNVAGLLVLGLRWWPLFLLNAFPAWWLAHEPLGLSLVASTTNALEALLAAWMIRRFGRFDGRIDEGRAVAALIAASLVAPLANTLVIPAWLCVRGTLAWADYAHALTNWNLSNGAAMLILVPLLFSLRARQGSFREHLWEKTTFAVLFMAVCPLAFGSVFLGEGFNFAFLVFPFVLYAAVRFGPTEMTLVLGAILIAIYGVLAVQVREVPPVLLTASIWFVQAFCWIVAATGLLTAALVNARQRAEAAAHAERERFLEASLQEERAQLKALRYQLNPHFLFNSLNSIYSTIPMRGADVSRQMITQLSGYLRSTLTDSTQSMHPLRDEIRSMEQYLAIERHRFGDELQVNISIGAGAEALRVPVLLLQPLVENAIQHGFSASKGLFHIKIRATVRSSFLELEVANSAPWQPGRGEGIGLANTRRRLELCFGKGASLQVRHADGWVCVKIHIPVHLPTDSSSHALPDP